MADGALLKVDRATKHIRDLNGLFKKSRAFVYVVETDTKTGQRATFAKQNKAVVDEASLICGDVVHNLRSALDHAYWQIINPFCSNEGERRKLQFPFSAEASGLDKAVQNGLACRAGTGFYCALRALRPHGEDGGNTLLYFIHDLNRIDKHRQLTPTGDYTQLSATMIRQQIPDFPRRVELGSFGGNARDLAWTSRHVPPGQLGKAVPDRPGKFERELDVPVEIVLEIGSGRNFYPLIPTLNAMVDVAKEAIQVIRVAADHP